ncbi:MAG: bifunctional 23S rRNA (guanine(2069)-N(7))-methyltransferase RlmK/23S rRNA (guanine(2445)-N(2))-methyltransferase RlmL [Halieaceae bacterium]
MKTQQWFASCPRGLESLLLQELESLGADSVKETIAGVAFAGPLAVAYRVALWTRLANRVLLSISEHPVGDSDNIHATLLDVAWEDYLAPGLTFVIDFSGQSGSIRNTQYGAQLAKDAILDRFRKLGLTRPQVQRKGADLRFQLRLHKGRLAVSLDFAGSSLHQRGYRLEAGKAPLKENLAAAMLLRADWPGIAARGGALIDPLCGSGTLLIEAAMMAADIAPGLARESWSFERLRLHNAEQWQALRNDAEARAAQGKARQLPEIRGYDASRAVVDKALANIQRVGLEKIVRVSCKPLAALKKPSHRPIDYGLLISNPPYGERLGDVEALSSLYREWGEGALREFNGWQGALLTTEKELGMATGLRSKRRYTLYNGALACTLLLFELTEENRLRPRRDAPQAGGDPADQDSQKPGELSAGAQMFANRLRKNLQQADRWARKQGYSCYRVYDADMPEYAVAIDRYAEALHVAEYKAPAGVAEAAAEQRLADIRQALPQVTGIEPQQIFYKQRRRQKGREQYQRSNEQGEFMEVGEGRVKLLVNLSDYLDTGLFLDHRPLRLRLAAESRGKDFLNLFCYTAAASVHAASGGARSTTSVDMSNTYLDWARRNLELNGFGPEAHHLQRADCQEWLAGCEADFDLILLDPPSFSNSKRMEGSFDVQRDHVELLRASMARLRDDGVLYFSNNLRSFKLDAAVEDFAQVEDISASSIDFDFRRRPRIHRCWRLGRK